MKTDYELLEEVREQSCPSCGNRMVQITSFKGSIHYTTLDLVTAEHLGNGFKHIKCNCCERTIYEVTGRYETFTDTLVGILDNLTPEEDKEITGDIVEAEEKVKAEKLRMAHISKQLDQQTSSLLWRDIKANTQHKFLENAELILEKEFFRLFSETKRMTVTLGSKRISDFQLTRVSYVRLKLPTYGCNNTVEPQLTWGDLTPECQSGFIQKANINMESADGEITISNKGANIKVQGQWHYRDGITSYNVEPEAVLYAIPENKK